MVANPFQTCPEPSYTKLLRDLSVICDKAHDVAWVHRRECYLRNKLREGLNHRKEFYCLAVQALVAILPVLRRHSHFFRWKDTIDDAISRAELIQNIYLQAEVLLALGEAVLLGGDYGTALRAADFAQSKTAECGDLEIQLKCSSFFLRVQLLRDFEGSKRQMIYKSLQLAKRVTPNSEVRANLYLTLSRYYSFRHKFRASEHYIRRAYQIFLNIGDVHGKLECMGIRAENASELGQQARANRILKRLENYVSANETLLYHAYWLYGRAGAALYQDDIQQAIGDYAKARVKFNQMKALPMVANCDHALALAYATSGDSRDARRHLIQARRIWSRLHVDYRLVDIEIAHGYLARKEGNLPKAMYRLAQASDHARKLADPHLQNDLMSRIETEADIIARLWNARR